MMFQTIAAGDLWFENLLLGLRSPFFVHLNEWITYAGNLSVVIGIAGLVTLGILFYKLNASYIAGLATTLIGAAGSDYVLKTIVGRARPGGLIPSAAEYSSSFPSWHATGAVALYGFIAYALCRMYPQRTRVVVTTATLIILAIGWSRLYLGLHFPTDVIAGYLLGGLWLLLGIKVTRRLERACELTTTQL